MNSLAEMVWVELRKANRSKIPLFTGLGFVILPLAMAFLMFVYKNPELARSMGLLSAKANLAGGSADWPFYLGMFNQGVSVAGILLFSLIVTWVFGREFSDHTVKDLLAVAVPRRSILLAKFIVAFLWSAVLTLIVYGIALFMGAVLTLPLGTPELFVNKTVQMAVTTCLVIVVITPVAFFASLGRGYLLPMGMTIIFLAIGNIVAVLGWGDFFPWAIPGLFAGISGETGGLAPASYIVALLTGLAGIAATVLWWRYADQSR